MTTILELPAELTTPADGDIMVIRDIDDATNKDKRLTWANIKATLKTYFDGIYSTKATVVGARVYNSANLSIGDSTVVTLTFNSERYDTGALHSTGSNTGRLTAPVTGKYRITANVAFASHATGRRIVLILLNGTTNIAQNVQSAVAGGYSLNLAHYPRRDSLRNYL